MSRSYNDYTVDELISKACRQIEQGFKVGPLLARPERTLTDEESAKYEQALNSKADSLLPKEAKSCSLRKNFGFIRRAVSGEGFDWVYTDDEICPECGAKLIPAFGANLTHP